MKHFHVQRETIKPVKTTGGRRMAEIVEMGRRLVRRRGGRTTLRDGSVRGLEGKGVDSLCICCRECSGRNDRAKGVSRSGLAGRATACMFNILYSWRVCGVELSSP